MKEINVASIYLYHTCNYNCSYCSAAQSMDKRKNEFSKAITGEGMKEIVDFFNERGQWHILYAGGEPTIHPSFIELSKELTKNHYLRMATNNSMNDEKLNRFVSELSPERFDYIQCSLQEVDEEGERFEKFLRRAKILSENGFKIFVTYVAVPDRLNDVKKYYDIFMSNGIPFVVQVFRGKYNGKIYPQEYTKEEVSFIDKYMISSMYRSLLDTVDREPTGKSCNAGYNRIYIDGISGNIYKCLLETTNILGNVYEDKVILEKSPTKCRAKTCMCVFEPDLELEELTYRDLDNILSLPNGYDKEIYKEYKEKSKPKERYGDYWEKRQRDILKIVFEKADGKVIGIYGTGNHTEKMIEAYNRYFGEMHFEIVYFDSDSRKWGDSYLNSKIYSPEEINKLNLDRVIISSHRFGQEIYDKIKKYEYDNIRIMKIYDSNDTIAFI